MKIIISAVLLVLASFSFFRQPVFAIDFTNVQAVNVIGSGAQITWTTNEVTPSKVYYGASAGNYNFISESRCDGGGNITSHCINLTGLSPSTVYYYKVESGTSSIVSYQFTSASGGGTSGCPTNVVSLLGSGCHDMATAYFNSAMDQYVNYGGSTVYYCSVNYISGCSTGSGVGGGNGSISVTGWGLGVGSDGVSTNGISFPQEMDQSTFTSQNFFIVKATDPIDPSYSVPLTIQKNPFYVNLVSSSLLPGTQYISVTKAGVRSLSGAVLSADYTCRFQGLSAGAYLTSCPNSTGGNFSTTTTTTTSPTPATPSNLNYSTSSGGATVNLNWTDNSGNETRFEIYRQLNGIWNYLAQVGANIVSYLESPPPGTYYYNIAACNGANTNTGCSNGSNTIGPITIGATIIPVSSTTVDLKVDGFDGTVNRVAPANYTLTWTTTGNPTVCVPGDTWANSGNLTIPTGNWSFNSVNVLGLKTYTLTCSNGNTSSSDTVYVDIVSSSTTSTSTPNPIPTSSVPVAPSDFKATTSPLTSDVLLGWRDNSSDENRFEIYYRPQGNVSWNYLVMLPQNSTSFTYYSHPYGTYNYLVKACNSVGCSASNIADVTRTTAYATSTYNAFVESTVTNENNQPISGAWIHVFSSDFSRNFDGATDSQGYLRLAIPSGSYWLEVFPPYNREDLIKPERQNFVVVAGEIKKINMKFGTRTTANKIVGGRVIFSNGSAVTDAEVGAYSYRSGDWTSTFVDANGNFSLRVGPGRWKIGFRPRNPETATWRFNSDFKEVEFRNDVVEESKSVNFTVPLASARLTVSVTDDLGNPLPGVGVIADTVSGKLSAVPETQASPEFRKTDSKGLASFRLSTGRYYLRAFLPPEKELLSPDETILDIIPSEEKIVSLVFKRRSEFAKALIQGVAKLEDGRLIDAFVWGWSETGGFNNARADEKGQFSFPVALGTRWHIGAGKEMGTFPYKAEEVAVEAKNQVVAVEIILAKEGAKPLPPSIEVTKEANQTIVAQAEDGAAITLPPQAAATNGKVEVEIKPTIEAPSQPAAKVVSTVYDVSIKDQSGGNITQLKDEVEITLPYNEEDLKKQKITEDSLIPSYFDESAGAWVKVDNYTIDKEKNLVILRVKHLTRFAIVAAADITPPAAPQNVRAVKGSPGEIVLSWSNPASDFSHAKIYRSVEKGALGTLLVNDLQTKQYTDMKGTSGKVYYYTVRAVDPAGNESNNTDQVFGTVVGEAVAANFTKNLSFGSRGETVITLQRILISEGLLPAGNISGYFGNLTRSAVIKFQEKYSKEILTPAGLSKGTGFVGLSTRQKLNKLIP